MTSASSAVEAAIYTLLIAADVGAAVYQDVPDDAERPLVIIGDISSEPFGSKDDEDRRVTVNVVTITSGEERKPVLDIQEKIETVGGAKVTADGWEMHFGFAGDDASLDEEGTGYAGASVFTVIALKL